jgi:hypothetical protein
MDQPESAAPLDPRLLAGLAVYQDVILNGQTAVRGARDCTSRLDLIVGHLPRCRSLLDVGSNFGWFGLKLCQAFPECVVASVEANPRSARIQRLALASHADRRMCLVTRLADARLAEFWAQAGRPIDAVLCLSVLHWISDHESLVSRLGSVADRLFFELPHPDEEGSGVEHLRREIGRLGPYLARVFPNRPRHLLGEVDSHRSSTLRRELWMVGPSADRPEESAGGLDVEALLESAVSWPPRSWWQVQLNQLVPPEEAGVRGCHRLLFTPCGLKWTPAAAGVDLHRLKRLAARVPEKGVYSVSQWIARRARQVAGRLARFRRRK